MDLNANWQVLLLSQITRGTFFLEPRIAIGMAPQVQQLLDPKKARMMSTSEIFHTERSAFSALAVSQSGGESFSIYDDAPEGSTAVFSINGTMLKYGTLCTYGTQEIAGFMREAINHKNIGSIVIEFDSGGGSVSAIAPIVQVINEAKALGKPVVADVDLCCSAAYYGAIYGDYIVARNDISAEIGSIGVMASFMDLEPYYKKMDINIHKIYADQSGHKNEAFELALEGKYDLIKKELLNPLAIAFQNDVKEQRGDKLDESVEGVLTGKTFYAERAREIGLIDEVGDQFTAIERAQQFAETRNFLSNKK